MESIVVLDHGRFLFGVVHMAHPYEGCASSDSDHMSIPRICGAGYYYTNYQTVRIYVVAITSSYVIILVCLELERRPTHMGLKSARFRYTCLLCQGAGATLTAVQLPGPKLVVDVVYPDAIGGFHPTSRPEFCISSSLL